jgi:hypothetical protein
VKVVSAPKVQSLCAIEIDGDAKWQRILDLHDVCGLTTNAVAGLSLGVGCFDLHF